jgi:hypothetical protein
MDPKALAIVTLRSLATLFAGTGRTKGAASLNLLADGVEAGVDVDDHMREVGDALKASGGDVTDDQWDDVHARITADSARLQAR